MKKSFYHSFIALFFLVFSSVTGIQTASAGSDITSNTTLSVPGTYSTIQAALSYLDDKEIANNATVTIQVACTAPEKTTYLNYQTILVSHPQGSRIEILGNVINPDKCTLSFQTGQNGLLVQHNNVLGKINGFTIKGQDSAGTTGIAAWHGADITIGSAMVIQDFNFGVGTKTNGHIFADTGVVSKSNTFAGFRAAKNGTIMSFNTQALNNLYGYSAIDGGAIHAKGSTAQDNTYYGFLAEHAAVINAENTSVSGNNVDYYGITTDGAYVFQ